MRIGEKADTGADTLGFTLAREMYTRPKRLFVHDFGVYGEEGYTGAGTLGFALARKMYIRRERPIVHDLGENMLKKKCTRV